MLLFCNGSLPDRKGSRMSESPHDIPSDTHIQTEDVTELPPSSKAIRAFALPSILGILAFLTPIKVDGNWTILMGWLSASATTFVGDTMMWIVFALLWISVIGTAIVKIMGPGRISHDSMTFHLFQVGPVWVALRSIGAVMGTMTIFQVGPEIFWHASTGGTVLHDLAFAIVPLFLFAGLLMPFLTDYGLMEFVGTLFKRLFRRLFTLAIRVRSLPGEGGGRHRDELLRRLRAVCAHRREHGRCRSYIPDVLPGGCRDWCHHGDDNAAHLAAVRFSGHAV
jgi:hypothetical protein